MPLTLLVMAAGMGSRYGGLKQVVPVGPAGETILDYSIYDALRAGFDRVAFVIREEIREAFAPIARRYDSRLAVAFAFQELDVATGGFVVPAGRTKPWGTGHAVLSAANVVTTPFAVINADDFYGRPAFAALARFFADAPPRSSGPDRYAMVAYRLGSTLSQHGAVARGVCSTKDGLLTGIEEITTIVRTPEGIEATHGGRALRFTGEEPVSLNVWGFDPSVFGHLRERFATFLAASGCDPKAEFYIPAAISDLIREGRAQVHVLTSEGSWLGVTYREDTPVVAASIRRLVDAGEYPTPLWGR